MSKKYPQMTQICADKEYPEKYLRSSADKKRGQSMSHEKSLAVFENFKIHRAYDENNTSRYFSVIDIVGALIDSVNPRDNWFKMKVRVKTDDGLELERKTGKCVVTGENFFPPAKS